jgi:hypothetical protein
VPPFLAEKLRREVDWHISESGVNRALEQGLRIRSALRANRPASVSVNADSSLNADSGLEEKR